jgi:uncharacterized membrane protein YeiB
MPDFNTAFLVLFVMILGALGVSNFVEGSTKSQAKPYQNYFALLYILMAFGLIAYKITNR